MSNLVGFKAVHNTQVLLYLLCKASHTMSLSSITYSDKCKPSPCKNSGKCVRLASDYRCDCAPGYTDKNCGTGKIYVHQTREYSDCWLTHICYCSQLNYH